MSRGVRPCVTSRGRGSARADCVARRSASARERNARLRTGGRRSRADRGSRVGSAGYMERLSPRTQAVTADLVYGRRAVREALRGRREVLELFASERALKAEPWLRDGPRV